MNMMIGEIMQFSASKFTTLILPMLVPILVTPTLAEHHTPPIPKAPGAEFRQSNQRLFEAAKKGRIEELVTSLRDGASIKARDRFGNTALLLAVRTSKIKSVEALLKAGSEVNHQNLVGSSALLRAATAGRRKIAKILIRNGAQINQANK